MITNHPYPQKIFKATSTIDTLTLKWKIVLKSRTRRPEKLRLTIPLRVPPRQSSRRKTTGESERQLPKNSSKTMVLRQLVRRQTRNRRTKSKPVDRIGAVASPRAKKTQRSNKQKSTGLKMAMTRLPKVKSLRDHRQLAVEGTLRLRTERRLKKARLAQAAELEAIAVGGTNHSLVPVKTTNWKILRMLPAIARSAIANHRKKSPPKRRRRA